MLKDQHVIKSTVDEIRLRFDHDVARFSNAETGQQTTIDAAISLELITTAAQLVNPQAHSLVDIGCGAGNYTLKMLSKIADMDCMLIDLSAPMLEKAQSRIKRKTKGKIHAIQGDIRKLTLESESTDVVLAGAVLHHLRSDEEWQYVFSAVYRALRPGGSFWISDLVIHDHDAVHSLVFNHYATYLESLGGKSFQEKVFAYIEKEDTPRSLNFQLDLLKKVGFSYTELLHKNACFAAFGGIK